MTNQTVIGGMLFFYGTAEHGLTLQTKDLMATFALADTGSFLIPNSPIIGEIADVSGNLAGDQTLRFGSAYYEGTRYAKLWYEGSLEFRAAPITVPRHSSNPVAVRTRFAFEGTLTAYESNNVFGGGGPAVLDMVLAGGGTATAYFGAAHSVGSTLVRDLLAQCYSFANRR